MRTKMIPLVVFMLMSPGLFSVRAESENDAEAKARAEYEAAEIAAREAEAAIGPLRDAMRAADEAYAEAARAATAARRKADEAKNLAGEPGVEELKRAEAAVPAAVEALTEASEAKPPLDEALAEARAAAQPLQEAYDAAEEAAQKAEAAARAAAEAASKLDDEAESAAAHAERLRTAADTAKNALQRATESKQQATAQAGAAPEALAKAEAEKKAADEALAEAQEKLVAARTAHEQAAQAAGDENAEDAAAKREAAEVAKGALGQAEAAEQDAQRQVAAATRGLARATAQKKMAEAQLAGAKKQIEAATAAAAETEQAAVAAEKEAEERKRVADEANAKRQAVQEARAALAKAKESEDEGQVAAATEAYNKAREAAGELPELDAAAEQTAAEAEAKRKVANEAQAALAPLAKNLEQASVAATRAAQALSRAEARKKSAEEELEDLKNRIAAAKETHEADEKAAQEAEAAAVPLGEEAEKTRTAYRAGMDTAHEKRGLAQQAKEALFRLIAAGRVPGVMELSDPPKPANRIDEIVFAKLKTLGVEPAVCSDAVFLRRAYLDITGRLPTAERARAFLVDEDPNKRAALIDHLLDQSAHADYWAMRWSDILKVKAEFPVNLWPNAAQAYHRWIWESIAQNKPYDQFVRELLTSSGSNFRVGPVNFYRAVQAGTPEAVASSTALSLMGTRTHLWPEERLAGMAAFFSQVGYKPTSEWKEEIIFWDPFNSVDVAGSIAPGIDNVAESVTATNQIPQALAEPLSMNEPLKAVFPDGTEITVPPDRDPREVFADWLIQPENPYFARPLVNRIWSWAMGRGIIHEPDDIRDDNPPSNPELLAYLEQEFIASGYDLKALKRLIFTSTTYQFSSLPRSEEPEAVANFASYPLRRVEAEVLIDAINQITGGTDLYTSAVPEPFTFIPESMSAVSLADGSITSSFLALFGRASRDAGMQSERVNELAPPQWLHVLNAATIQSKLQNGPKLRALVSEGSVPEITEKLYLTIVSRFPTDADIEAVESYIELGVAKGRDVWIDVAWALISSPEFLLRR